MKIFVNEQIWWAKHRAFAYEYKPSTLYLTVAYSSFYFVVRFGSPQTALDFSLTKRVSVFLVPSTNPILNV